MIWHGSMSAVDDTFPRHSPPFHKKKASHVEIRSVIVMDIHRKKYVPLHFWLNNQRM